MSQKIVAHTIRLPRTLKEAVHSKARAENRSFNSQVVDILEKAIYDLRVHQSVGEPDNIADMVQRGLAK